MFKPIIIFALLFHLSRAALEEQNKDIHDCDSKMFCYGDLLETIQLSQVNGDNSEKFVEMKTLDSPDNIWKKFSDLKEKNKDLKDDVEELCKFLNENFDEDPLQPCEVTDYKEMDDPQNIIADETYLNFYRRINPTWADLGVKTNAIPEEVSDRHSTIELPYYFIKTGDSQSFPELWQNYLIVRGLLWNDMYESASNIIKNLADLSKERNFIPLTNRVYATKRHQLPLLSFMVDDYLQAYDEANNIYDTGFLQKMYPVVEAELNWWIEKAGAGIRKDSTTYYSLFKYTSLGQEPRPEKYKEDYNLAEKIPSQEEKIRFYSAVRALDNTAFGYSSRFLQNKKYQETRSNLEVDRFVPVELNSVLQRCAYILSDWFVRLGKKEAVTYKRLANDIQYGIDKILWSEKHKMWLDYDLQTGQNVDSFYITNLIPLFTLSYNKEKYDPTPNVLSYLHRENIISVDNNSNYDFKYRAIPTSNNESGEISDKPYGSIFWNLLIIEGLRETKHGQAKQVAQKMAAALVKTIYNEHERHNTLFENYRIDGPIEEDEIEKLNKSSTSTLGGLITLLRWYGLEIKYAAADRPTEIGATSDRNTSKSRGESNMSISADDDDLSLGKRPMDIAAATTEDNPDLKQLDTSEGKKRKIEKDISKP